MLACEFLDELMMIWHHGVSLFTRLFNILHMSFAYQEMHVNGETDKIRI